MLVSEQTQQESYLVVFADGEDLTPREFRLLCKSICINNADSMFLPELCYEYHLKTGGYAQWAPRGLSSRQFQDLYP